MVLLYIDIPETSIVGCKTRMSCHVRKSKSSPWVHKVNSVNICNTSLAEKVLCPKNTLSWVTNHVALLYIDIPEWANVATVVCQYGAQTS